MQQFNEVTKICIWLKGIVYPLQQVFVKPLYCIGLFLEFYNHVLVELSYL